MYYFSYGSNMSTRRLGDRLTSVEVVTVASLSGHRLAWHKRGMDGSAKCDAEHTGNEADHIIGVVFEVTGEDRLLLDRFEGLGKGYIDKRIAINATGGELLEAFTYTATDIDGSLWPYDWYKHHVLAGAREHRLPTAYTRQIEQVLSVTDPLQDRYLRELSIYN